MFLMRSIRRMSYRRLKTLGEVINAPGVYLRITCPKCGNTVIYSALELAPWFKRKSSTSLEHVAAHMVCRGRDRACGHRGALINATFLEDVRPAPPRPQPVIVGAAPIGVDPAAWAKADERGRKRLIRQARG